MSGNMALAEFLILILVTKRLLSSQRSRTSFPTAQSLIPKSLLAMAGVHSGILLI